MKGVQLYEVSVAGRDPWSFYVVATSWEYATTEAELSIGKGEHISQIKRISDRVVVGEDV